MDSPLVAAVAQALAAALPPGAGLSAAGIRDLLGRPPSAELGDLAFPCFRLAKALRKAPPVIAAELAAALAEGGPIARAVAAGPYVNLTLDLAHTAALVLPGWARGEAPAAGGAGERVMVEFSQPNTHKAFHVGHLRNVCLGDALVRILRANGHDVVAANYLGDVGAHIARCLWWYLDVLSADERTPPAEHRGEWLGELYTRATIHLEDLEQAAAAGDAPAASALATARARTTEILQRLEARDPELTRIWRETRQWSLDDFDAIYRWCDVTFDRVFYESEVDEPGLALVEEFLARGVFQESEGAIGIHNPEIPYMPFFMLRKRDGTSLYATKDLALARLKFEEYRVDRSIYVVDSRQADHFRHVFLTLRKMGFAQAERCEHVPYEMVELPDGSMSSRRGNVVLFRRLRERMEATLRSQHFAKYVGEWNPDEIDRTVHEVALGAIRYGMLSRDVSQKIVFDLAAWLELEGNTGPYLQYVTARTASVLRRGAERGKTLDPAVLAPGPAQRAACAALALEPERALVLALAALPAVVARAAADLRPAPLCTALFELCRTYNAFQNDERCQVIRSEGALLQGRLLLVSATREALGWGLSLLGIPAPARM
jgi:arginyl-tRNA synthetase